MNKPLLIALCSGCLALAASATALAQSGIGNTRLSPPTMNPPKEPDSDLGAMATGVLLLLLVLGANLIPSKRGHKD